MAIDWYAVRADPIEAIQHGVDATADAGHLETTHTGPRTFGRIDYPVGEVLPQESARTDGNEFRHTVYANLYIERSREMDYLADVLHPTAAVISESMSALSNTKSVVSYVPASVEDFAGQLDDTLLLLVTIRFEVSTLHDLADT